MSFDNPPDPPAIVQYQVAPGDSINKPEAIRYVMLGDLAVRLGIDAASIPLLSSDFVSEKDLPIYEYLNTQGQALFDQWHQSPQEPKFAPLNKFITADITDMAGGRDPNQVTTTTELRAHSRDILGALQFVGMAIASGIIGNLSYDMLKSVIQRVVRNRQRQGATEKAEAVALIIPLIISRRDYDTLQPQRLLGRFGSVKSETAIEEEIAMRFLLDEFLISNQ